MATPRQRRRAGLWLGLAAVVFMCLGDPIWYGLDWRSPLFIFVADTMMFIAGGLTLAWWLARTLSVRSVAAPAE